MTRLVRRCTPGLIAGSDMAMCTPRAGRALRAGLAAVLLGAALLGGCSSNREPNFPTQGANPNNPDADRKASSNRERASIRLTLATTYFQNGQYWNLSLSVYLQGIVAWLLGKSIVVTRGVSALVSLSGVIAVALALKLVFRIRYWWVSVFVLATIPAFFIHSRTAFEVILMVSFYAWFLFFYLLYRYRNPLYLFQALIFGGMTFYAYANGQSVMAVTGVLLLISDFRYHLRNPKLIIPAAVLLIGMW